jgi:LCP family protein required for cell wall assembly
MIVPDARRSPWRRRLGFSTALVAGAAASGYVASILLMQIAPALFPGQALVIPVIERLPDPIEIVVPPPAENAFTDPVTVVFMGLDRRPGQDDPRTWQTDLVAVGSVDPQTKRAALLSFPRDLLITVTPSAGESYEDRINASFSAGARRDGTLEAGAEQLVSDMKRNFGVKADYWVVVDFRGMERLIDAVGGIDITVPDDLAVGRWWYSDDDDKPRWVSFPAGLQHLDGYHAVAFSRSREQDDDMHRIRRQQLVLQAALSQAMSLRVLARPLELWSTYGDTVKTNLSAAKLAGLTPLLRQTAGSMQTYSLADPVGGVPTVRDFVTGDGAAVLEWDRQNVQFWLDQVIVSRTEQPPERAGTVFDQ